MTPHLLQSAAWKKFQLVRGITAIDITASDISCTAYLEKSHGRLGRFFQRLYVPYGPSANTAKMAKEILEAIENNARQHKADSVRIEPMGSGFNSELLRSVGYTKRAKSSQPEVTNIVVLKDKSEDQIVASMNATNRNLWRKNLQLGVDGVVFRVDKRADQAGHFLEMMHDTSKRTGAVFHSDSYFKDMINSFGEDSAGGIVTASHGGKDLASALFVVDAPGKTLYYLHAGSFIEARTLNAGNVLVSYLIMYAKSLGLEYVDLFGVSPADAPETHPLYGISKFKRAYGGEDRHYLGTWEKSLTRSHRALTAVMRARAKGGA